MAHDNLTAPVSAPAPTDIRAGGRERQDRFDRFDRASEWPVGLLAMAVIPVILVENYSTDPFVQNAALWANWVVWLAFCADYSIKLWLAPSRKTFVRSAWLDLAVVIVSPPFLGSAFTQGTRSLRLLRVFRVLRSLTLFSLIVRKLAQGLIRRKFHQVLMVSLAATFAGALGVWVFERDVNQNVSTLGSALWWAVVTVTTVGYGDISPVSVEGRIIAVLLMVIGIGVIGAFTGSVASYLTEQDSAASTVDIESRLSAIERKVDMLLKRADDAKQ